MGRDCLIFPLNIQTSCFNPRARMGRDFALFTSYWQSDSFNPRARMGRDAECVNTALVFLKFQSTRPHGARRFSYSGSANPDKFQSTRPHGARLLRLRLCQQSLQVSIHAPAWGATLCHGQRQLLRRVSIHAPAWGATRAL